MRHATSALRALLLLLLLTGTAAAQQEIPGAMRGAEMRWLPTLFILAEKLEIAPDGSGRPVALDVTGWYGGAHNRIWLRAEADLSTESNSGELQIELLYGRLITAFFDGLVGIRVDRTYGAESATRALLSIGVAGLAPNWFELEASGFLSQDGDLGARLTASYDLLFTQRLVLAPRVELNASARRVPEFGIGSGLSDLELGGRLRYELHRKFAPYAGIDWHRRFGGTAEFARAEGDAASEVTLVAGLRLWY